MSGTRPPRPGTETRQRRRLVAVRCTDAELADIEAKAEWAGMTVGAYMRHQATGTSGPRAVSRPQVDRAALARVLAHLGHYGANLNQLAHRANAGEIPNWQIWDRDRLTELRDATRDMRAALMAALGRGH